MNPVTSMKLWNARVCFLPPDVRLTMLKKQKETKRNYEGSYQGIFLAEILDSKSP